ncbi:MAG: 3-dehydroquinate synthase [Fimbriiglobus sp.]
MKSVEVNLGPRSYAISLAPIARFLDRFREQFPHTPQALLAYDSHLASLAERLRWTAEPSGLKLECVEIPSGEGSKSFAMTQTLYDHLARMAANRRTPVIALGGGVVGDLAGFAAATYNRGLPLVMIPTTLLSMVDSSVGGKVGINHPAGKNLIGAFHQPKFVWIDPTLMLTLPDREFRSGLAEVVKYGVILDPALFEYLEDSFEAILARQPAALEHIIARSCRIKADVVEKDEFEETGLRAKLNYGHTFAHAYEAISGYGTWLHGEAVAAGMVTASRLAEKLGRISSDVTERQVSLLTRFGLPTSPEPAWDVDEMLKIMARDKKAEAGKMRFILPTKLGEVELVSDVPEALVRKVMQS